MSHVLGVGVSLQNEGVNGGRQSSRKDCRRRRPKQVGTTGATHRPWLYCTSKYTAVVAKTHRTSCARFQQHCCRSSRWHTGPAIPVGGVREHLLRVQSQARPHLASTVMHRKGMLLLRGPRTGHGLTGGVISLVNAMHLKYCRCQLQTQVKGDRA